MPDEARQRSSDRTQDGVAVTFVGFIVTLARTAAVHFGDLPDPVTGIPAAVDLSAAQQIIDVVAMLEEKTRGNLSPEERQLIEGVLHDLRMRYVEVSDGRAPGLPPDHNRP